MAKNQKQAKKTKESSGMRTILFLFMILATGIIMFPFAVLILVGMMPSIVSWIMEQNPHKNISATMAQLNFCGVVPNIMTLWSKGGDLNQALLIVQDPFSLLFMYGAAAMGWLVTMAMPPIMSFVISAKASETIKRLESRKLKLYEEWGDSIKESVVEVSTEQARSYQLD